MPKLSHMASMYSYMYVIHRVDFNKDICQNQESDDIRILDIGASSKYDNFNRSHCTQNFSSNKLQSIALKEKYVKEISMIFHRNDIEILGEPILCLVKYHLLKLYGKSVEVEFDNVKYSQIIHRAECINRENKQTNSDFRSIDGNDEELSIFNSAVDILLI